MNSIYVRCTKSIIYVNSLRWSQLNLYNAKRKAQIKCATNVETEKLPVIEYLRGLSNKDNAVALRTFDEKKESGHQQFSSSHWSRNHSVFYWASIWTWLGLAKEESPEDKLITTIKRGILCMQREEYDKAEQILHLALRMAQDINSKDGVTYVYDVMANLAMEREQFHKAEKLFVHVMRRLMSAGYTEDSPKLLHISSKIAHMAHLQGDLDKARIGFLWTLDKIEHCIKKTPNDRDIQELWGLTRNWFGQLLMKLGKFKDAKYNFEEAYKCLIRIRGEVNDDAITILNNISVACVNMDNYSEAKKHLRKALQYVKEIHDTTQEGILYANLGLVHLREGLLEEARKCCTHAWKTGKRQNNHNAMEQAKYCLQEISDYEKQPK